MTGPEVTAAIERAGRAIWEHDNGHTTWPPRDPLEIGPCEDAARAALTTALDVGEMARAIDAWAFRDHTNNSVHMQDQCAARRNVATLAAQRIRATILGGAA